MDQMSLLAASGLRARMESLDMLANNLSNASTAGFKMDREFYSLFVGQGTGLTASSALAAKAPLIERQWTDFSQGTLQPTGNPTDLALEGKGFFVLQGPVGPLYTRSGNFQISPAGELVSPEGHRVLDVDGKPIRVAAGAPFDVQPDGVLQQGGRPPVRIAVVNFADASVLAKEGNTCFRNVNPAQKPAPATGAKVQQGRTENSNVGTAESAIRLVGVMRQFEMLQKALTISSEMNRRSVEEVAKVGS